MKSQFGPLEDAKRFPVWCLKKAVWTMEVELGDSPTSHISFGVVTQSKT